MTIPFEMTRVVYIVVWFAILLLDGVGSGFIETIDQNRWNILAGCTGALAVRFAYDKMPLKTSIGGFLVGALLAFLFGAEAYESHWLGHHKYQATVWGLIGLIADGIIQLVGWLIRLAKPIGQYTVEHPADAFNQGIDMVHKGAGAAGKVAEVWTRISPSVSSAVDLFQKVFNLFSAKK